MFLPFRVGESPSEAGSDLLLSVIDSQEDSSIMTQYINTLIMWFLCYFL